MPPSRSCSAHTVLRLPAIGLGNEGRAFRRNRVILLKGREGGMEAVLVEVGVMQFFQVSKFMWLEAGGDVAETLDLSGGQPT